MSESVVLYMSSGIGWKAPRFNDFGRRSSGSGGLGSTSSGCAVGITRGEVGREGESWGERGESGGDRGESWGDRGESWGERGESWGERGESWTNLGISG